MLRGHIIFEIIFFVLMFLFNQPSDCRWCPTVTSPRSPSIFHLDSRPRGKRTCDTSWTRRRRRGGLIWAGGPSPPHLGSWEGPQGVEGPSLILWWVLGRNTTPEAQTRQVGDDVGGLLDPTTSQRCNQQQDAQVVPSIIKVVVINKVVVTNLSESSLSVLCSCLHCDTKWQFCDIFQEAKPQVGLHVDKTLPLTNIHSRKYVPAEQHSKLLYCFGSKCYKQYSVLQYVSEYAECWFKYSILQYVISVPYSTTPFIQ